MKISDYTNAANKLIRENRQDEIFVRHGSARFTVERSLALPAPWSNGVGAPMPAPSEPSLRAEDASTYERQQRASRRFREGFVEDLHAAFGGDIAGECLWAADVESITALTARTLIAVVEQAERRQHENRLRNKEAVVRHLDLWRRNSVLEGGKSSPVLFGELAGKFITAYAAKCCSDLPEYSQGVLSKTQMGIAAAEAIALYREIRETPGLSDEHLGIVLARACAPASAVAMRGAAREYALEQAVVAVVRATLDWRNPGSFLSRSAAAVTAGRGMPPLPTSALSALENALAETVRVRLPTLPERFHCEGDVQSILAALAGHLETAIEKALRQHCAALQVIEASQEFTPDAKDALRALAATRRFDLLQLGAYEWLAKEFATLLRKRTPALQRGHVGALIDGVRGIVADIHRHLSMMRQAGEGLWDSASLSGKEMPLRLAEQAAALAVAGVSQAAARGQLDLLGGEAGHQIVQCLKLSADPELGPLAARIYGALVEALAVRAGLSAAVARARAARLYEQGIADGVLPLASPALSPAPALLALEAAHDFQRHPAWDKALTLVRRFLADDASLPVELSPNVREPILTAIGNHAERMSTALHEVEQFHARYREIFVALPAAANAPAMDAFLAVAGAPGWSPEFRAFVDYQRGAKKESARDLLAFASASVAIDAALFDPLINELIAKLDDDLFPCFVAGKQTLACQ